jgi:hypothetical protein
MICRLKDTPEEKEAKLAAKEERKIQVRVCQI